MQLRLPNITNPNPAQIQTYLYQLVGDLQWALETIEKKQTDVIAVQESAGTGSLVEQEAKAQANFDEIKSLIIKSADIVSAYYQDISKLFEESGRYVTTSDFGSYTETTNATILANSERLDSTFTKIGEIESDVDMVREEQTKVTETAKDVKISVSKIEGICHKNADGEIDGVTGVKTSTNYTFDEDGLSIEKDGSQMKTQITEDGMTVYKNKSATLTANSEGVNAVDLHASTYLIVGKGKGRSRFEDYGTDRTGCFWIG